MDDCYRNLSHIPVSNIAARLDLSDIEAVLDAAKVMPEPVGQKEWFFVGGLDNILQSVQLPIVKLNDLTGIGIDGSVCQLRELTGERCGIGSSHFAVRKLQDELLLQILIAAALRIG